MNVRDSEIIEQLLAQDGYLSVSSPDTADLILINTCSIRAKAEQKVYSFLGQLRDFKQSNPNLYIGVAGCVAQQEGDQIFKRMPHVDIVVGTQQIYQLPEMLTRLKLKASQHEMATDLSSSFSIPAFQKLLNNKNNGPCPAPLGYKRFVTIMQGCDNYCSYCIVPTTRGRETSRQVADIIEEVSALVQQGVKEVTLLGQNVNSYGQTNSVGVPGATFADLLHQVAAIKGVERLRFTTSHPKDLSEELMQCFADIDVLCPQFHLPVQSGSDNVLKRMNRKYTVADYLQKVDVLRSYQPSIALATDVIVGFPGETDTDFQATMDLLEKVRFHGSFSFKYSDRPGTESAGYGEKVPEEVKKERLQLFQQRQDDISLERNNEYIDSILDVMVESSSDQGVKGRTASNHLVHFDSTTSPRPGDTVEVLINHAGKHSLKGIEHC